ncbi:hypothetical protein ScPMuIL_012927 [Solemya velum]
MEIIIQSSYAFIILIVCCTWFLLNWLESRVLQGRSRHHVPYPNMYSDHSLMFNCIQRAHQNTLEVYPMFLVLLIFGGLQYPKLSAVCGVIWIVSRVFYALGYYTGDPEKRKWGTFGYIGMLILLIINVKFALNLLGLI